MEYISQNNVTAHINPLIVSSLVGKFMIEIGLVTGSIITDILFNNIYHGFLFYVNLG